MAETRRFPTDAKAPFIRRSDDGSFTTNTMIRDFMVALVPLTVFLWLKNGLLPFITGSATVWELLYPLLLVGSGIAFSFLVEAIYFSLTLSWPAVKLKLSQSFPFVSGWLLALIVPPSTPIWVLFLGIVFGVAGFKLLFGGFGHNIFNPALAGYLFINLAFYGVITQAGGIFNSLELLEVTSSVTPLAGAKGGLGIAAGELVAPYGTNLWTLFLGFYPGGGAETASLLILAGGVYLALRKVIDWRIPVCYVGTVFVLTWFVGLFGPARFTLTYPLFYVLSGGLLFGAVFMATDPVTGPRTKQGKVVTGLALGILTVLLRFTSNMAEGVAVSILFMNLVIPMIDKVLAVAVQQAKWWKKLLPYCAFGAIAVVILLYMFLKLGGI